jgi:hypothetical protein
MADASVATVAELGVDGKDKLGVNLESEIFPADAFSLAAPAPAPYARANPKTEPVVLMITHILYSAGFVTIPSR